MRVPVLTRLVAALTLSVLIATAFPATADPARSIDRSPAKPSAPLPAPSRTALDENFGRLPLQFEVNRGQVDSKVRYLTRGRGSTLFLTDDEAVWVLSRQEKAPGSETKDPLDRRERNRDRGKRISSVVRMSLEGSKPKPRLEGLDRLPGNVNYFIGNDPKKWRTDVPTYRKVKVENVYAGIDLLYYGNQRQVEYDFVVKPGVDPSVIRVAFTGADRISTDASGDLVVSTAAGDLRMKSPLVYQERSGQRELVAAAYVVRPGEKRVEFRIAKYDGARELVIDPVIVWSTFLGGGAGPLGSDSARSIAIGGDGNPVVAGNTTSYDFPTTPGAFLTNDSSGAFVSKLNPSGTAFVYSTYIGASGSGVEVNAVAADSAGAAYITGSAWSGHFPVTPGAFQTPGYVFVTKLNSSGNALVYSASLGGIGSHDEGRGIAVDSGGTAFVTGNTTDQGFPTTPGALQDTTFVSSHGTGFVTRVSSNGGSLLYSTILGGVVSTSIAFTEAEAISTDGAGHALITGSTSAADFPISPLAYQPTLSMNSSDVFVTKLSADGTSLVFSTFVGGSINDQGTAVRSDAAGNVFVTGNTYSNHIWADVDFPTTPGAFLEATTNPSSGFVLKLAPDGTQLLYSTLISSGGTSTSLIDLALDQNGLPVIAGEVFGFWFPFSPSSPRPRYFDGSDPFIATLNGDGSALSFSAGFGAAREPVGFEIDRATALALGPGGDAFVTGQTTLSAFPTTPGVVQPSYGGGQTDSFVVRIHLPLPVSATSISPATGPSLGGTPVTITGTGFQAGVVVRLGGIPASVSSVTATSISAVTGPHPDGLVNVEVENPDGGGGLITNGFTYVCAGTAPTATLTGGASLCAGQSATLSVALTGTGPWSLIWSDGVTQSGLASSPATRVVTPLSTTTYTVLTVADTICAGTAAGSAVVTVSPVPSATLTAPARVCAGRVSTASVPLTTGATYVWTVTNGAISSGQGTNSLSFVGTSDPVTIAVEATLGACSASDSRAIPVSVSPTGSVSGGGAICAGGSTSISFNLVGTAPFSITWSDGFVQSVSAAGPGTRTVSPTATRSYTIAALNDGVGCPAGTGTGSATVTVNPLPSVAIAAQRVSAPARPASRPPFRARSRAPRTPGRSRAGPSEGAPRTRRSRSRRPDPP
ncbi:MAG: SBBP repeat-containing protein [Holophagales bacterium]|nr:SBBP repeat-containing protein [Holophagales bacterium]